MQVRCKSKRCLCGKNSYLSKGKREEVSGKKRESASEGNQQGANGVSRELFPEDKFQLNNRTGFVRNVSGSVFGNNETRSCVQKKFGEGVAPHGQTSECDRGSSLFGVGHPNKKRREKL